MRLAVPLAGALVTAGVAVAAAPAVAATTERFQVRYAAPQAWSRTLSGNIFELPGRAQHLRETRAGWVADPVTGTPTGKIVPGHGLRTTFQVRNTSGERMRLAVLETGPALSATHPVDIVVADGDMATTGLPRDAAGCRLAGQTVLDPGQVLDVTLDARLPFDSVTGLEGVRTETYGVVTVAAAQEASSGPFDRCPQVAAPGPGPAPTTSPSTPQPPAEPPVPRGTWTPPAPAYADPGYSNPGYTDLGFSGYTPGSSPWVDVPAVAPGNGNLAWTGVNVAEGFAAGAVLVGAGAGLLLGARRRRQAGEPGALLTGGSESTRGQ